MAKSQIIVIDDELAIRQVLSSSLRRHGYDVEDFGNGEDALERLIRGDIDIAICDIHMPGMSGIDLMRKAMALGIDTTFLLMTAYASIDSAIEVMKLGAFDYMMKPVHTEEVLHQIKQVSDVRGLRTENRLLRSIVLGEKEKRCQLESSSEQEIQRMVDKVAQTDSTVLITGESGTGKGVIARNIHKQSDRCNEPFIPVNCGSIPENLMESELFGHTKGAFTGADRSKKGLFVEADKGTIFLDEIGELPLNMQVKLLHVLEDKEVRPLGSEKTKQVNVRIIAATNRDLKSMAEKNYFREDLYFRLNVFHMHIPALRERKDDIINLVHFFLARDASRLAKRQDISLDVDAENELLTYSWPGNIREVENVISRALILADSDTITTKDIPSHIVGEQINENVNPDIQSNMGLREQLRAVEHSLIIKAIDKASGDRQLAARELGIGQSTLYRKLEEFEQSRKSLYA